MGNFEYIISSLPFLTADFRYADGQGFEKVMEEIRENLSEKDSAILEVLLRGFRESELTKEFYADTLAHPQPFIRAYFTFDRILRNAKVRFLNRQLGRPEEEDVLRLSEEEEEEFPQQADVSSALSEADLLSREKALDDIVWKQVDELSLFHYFDLTAVLAYVAKLHIVDRWLSLDESKGRELFKKLVEEVKGTYQGVKFEA
ncbi:MAG: DUF2764 domain-containing protein [Bacteroidales bacterium]|nr:DUF2764 domain-containing protein [Bacteroidales bacterium]